MSRILRVLLAWFAVVALTWAAGWWLPNHELSNPEGFQRFVLVVLFIISAIVAWVTSPQTK